MTVVAAAAAAFAVCGGLVAPATADAVAGGEPVPADSDRFAARITSEGHACGGALIDPQWIVTAASCLPSGVDTASVAVGAESRHIAQVVPRTDRDLALVELTYPIDGVAPVRVGTVAPSAGETLKAEGFGRTTTEWVPDRLASSPVTVGTSSATTVTLANAAGNDLCRGDAGGPVLRQAGGQAELAGIAVTGWQHGCLDSAETRQGTTAVRVDDIAGWIGEQVKPKVLRLVNRATQRCLAVEGARNVNDAPAFQFDCPPAYEDQSWEVEPVAGGGVLVRNHATKRCLIVHAGGNVNGSPAVQFGCAPQFADQLWDLNPVKGGFQLRNRGTGRCLAVEGADNVNAARAFQFDCPPAYDDQVWDLTGVPETTQVRNRGTQRCLAVQEANNVNDAPAFQFDCPPAYPDQAWEIEPHAGGGFLVRNHATKRCLIVHAGDSAALAVQFDCMPQFADQLWDLTPVKGGVQLRNRGTGRCLALAGDNVNGNRPAQADCATAGDNQTWDVVRFPAGTTGAQSGPARTAADGQPSLVEDFGYPGADRIFADTGVKLISGDGHILFADCATPRTGDIGLLQVHSSESVGTKHDGVVCFKITASSGTVQVKIPAVFEIRGDGYVPGAGHKVKAKLTTDAGTQSTVDVNPSGSTQVGQGTGPGAAPTTLLQLTAGS
ncbi:RICIN domain-containing protein [Amycolatopsis sp. NPDC021455]|uniref:RICIN domain-containing protein n=1 Tax=Amycolatopsis sp. NPDC021455 TaxID=3154901 RepID=UPI0033F9C029